MKKLQTIILICGTAFCTLRPAVAAQLRVSDGTTTVIVADGDALDSNPDPGVVTYNGPVGANWTVNISSGTTKPGLGSAASPFISVGTTSFSSAAGTLKIAFTETGFTASGAALVEIGGTTPGDVTCNLWMDPGNTLFGETTLVSTLGPLTPTSGSAFSGTGSGVISSSTPYSMTVEAIIDHPGVGLTTFTAPVTITPPACNCTLTFISPSAITNCASDTIPDVIASQVCDGGLSNNVPVTFLGAVTNGTCPKIITRTNSAMDSCGNLYTNVQTITVNCRGSICGHIFADCDGSGDLTAGDVGLGKVTVTLLDASGNVVATQITDSNGGYCFIDLGGGSYTVSVAPPSGYCQTAASTSYHWKDSYGRICWQENDGNIHCLSSGTECWWDKSNTCHWKDSYGRDCWKDNWGYTHCQPCSYQSCNAQTYNNKISVSLANCASQSDVDFAYTGTKSAVSCSVSCPTYVKCGQTCTFTCTVVNSGNACFTGGTVCHTIGNCGWYGWNNCTTYSDKCPPLSPGQSCTFTHKCTFNSWNCGTIGCQSTANCNSKGGNSYCQSSCYGQCGW